MAGRVERMGSMTGWEITVRLAFAILARQVALVPGPGPVPGTEFPYVGRTAE